MSISVCPVPKSFAGSAKSEDELVQKLKTEIKALDPNIISVRPARAKQLSLARFKIQWMPAVILKRGTSFSKQEKIAKKVAKYVVDFQGGVKTKGVLGGIICFLEGKGWYPKLKNVSYKIVKKKPLKIEVWTNYQKPNEHGTATCCDPGKRIGRIRNDKLIFAK